MRLKEGLELLCVAMILSDSGPSPDEKSFQSVRTSWPPMEIQLLCHVTAVARKVRAIRFRIKVLYSETSS